MGAYEYHGKDLSLQGRASDALTGWNSGAAAAIHILSPIPLEKDLNPYSSMVLQRLSEIASLQSCFDKLPKLSHDQSVIS